MKFNNGKWKFIINPEKVGVENGFGVGVENPGIPDCRGPRTITIYKYKKSTVFIHRCRFSSASSVTTLASILRASFMRPP